MQKIISVILLLIIFATLVFAATPERSGGISIHMLPKRVAEMGGTRWGLAVDYSPKLKTETTQPILQSPQEFLSYLQKQEKGVQENGVWIVVTNPTAYSEEENKLIEDLKSLCRREKIPLFICRAAELPNGWKRYDQ